MIVTIEETEMKDAVVEWLKTHYGVVVTREDLTPKMEVEGQYEERTSTMVGFTFKVTGKNIPK